MISPDALNTWRTTHPWTDDDQIEQDLVMTRIAIEIASHPDLHNRLAIVRVAPESALLRMACSGDRPRQNDHQPSPTLLVAITPVSRGAVSGQAIWGATSWHLRPEPSSMGPAPFSRRSHRRRRLSPVLFPSS